MDLGIAGKWALVGGASKGLGHGCARALALEGVNVVMVARHADVLGAAVAALQAEAGASVEVLGVTADITSQTGRDAVFARRADYDIVVTNAGGPAAGDFRDWGQAEWMDAVNANMYTPIALIRATVDGMLERGFGRIVNITSSAVKQPIDVLGLSGGARSGLTGFVAGLARNPEIARRGVTINNLLPGRVYTDRIRHLVKIEADRSGKTEHEVRAQQQARIPAGRYGTPEEFGALCVFLCSQQAAYFTGQNVLMDGGAYPGTF